MHSTAFENAYVLQSIGWAILNSFWQAGALWLVYIFIIRANKKAPAIFKYDLGLMLLFISFVWFGFTIIETYGSLINLSPVSGILIASSVQVIKFQQMNTLLPYLSILYAGLLCFYTIQFINNYRKTISLQKNTLIKAPFDLRMFTKNIALHFGIKKNVQVWLSEMVDVPSVIGFIKPVILLPAAVINHLTTDQLEAVLLHELAHIKRNDYFINLLQAVAEMILFFNPFIKLLSNSIKKERENCCDDWVINYQYNKHQYANALLVLEERRKQQLTLVMAATNKKEFLLQRIKRLFNTEPQTRIDTIQKLQIIGIGIFLFSGILLLFPFTNNKMENKNAVVKTSFSIKPQPLAAAYHLPVPGKKETINIETINPSKSNVAIARKRIIQKPVVNKEEGEYTLALVNDELLGNAQQPIPIAASNKEITDSSYYVKVEEQESGKKQSTVCYFQLNKNNDNGQTSVKPLIMLKKHLPKKPAAQKKSRPAARERVTS